MDMPSTSASRFKVLPPSGIPAAIALCCLVIFLASSAAAQDVIESLQFNSRWPDASPGNLARSAAGENLYIASGNVLIILDQGSFAEKSRIAVPASRGITGIAVAPERRHVYAALGRDGMVVIDVSDEQAPFKKAELKLDPDREPIQANGIDILEHTVYLADNSFGLRLIDVSNPGNPNQAGAFEQVSRFTDEEGETATSSGGYVNVAAALAGEKKLAFVLDQFMGLRVFDTTAASEPEHLGAYDMRTSKYFGQLSEVVDIVVEKNRRYAYVTDATYGVTILDYSGLLPGSAGEEDISKAGQIKTPGSASGLSLLEDGRLLFVADGNSGLLVADVTDPTAKEYDQTEEPVYPSDLVNPEAYAADGAYAAVADGARLYLANAGEGLTLLGRTRGLEYKKTGSYGPPADATAVRFREDHIYTLDAGGPEEGLRILEVLDNESGRAGLVGFLPTPGNAEAIALSGDFAYVADGPSGVSVIHIADKAAPVLESSFPTPGDALDIALFRHEKPDRTVAYIADGSYGLVTAEVGEDGGLSEIGAAPVANARAVSVGEAESENNGKTAIHAVVANTSGITILEVTDPSDPVRKGFFDTSQDGGSALDVAVRHPYAIVANGEGGVLLVAFSDPENPELIDTYAAEGTAEAVFLKRSYIHAAVGERGLLVLGLTETETASLTPIDIDPAKDSESPYYNTPGYAADAGVGEVVPERYTYIADTHGGLLSFVHTDRLGGGIDEQPFKESPDDKGCFIQSLGLLREAAKK